MTEDDWESGFGRSIAVYLNGDGIPDTDTRGQRMTDDSFYLCYSAHDDAIEFTLPGVDYCPGWKVVIDTRDESVEGSAVAAGESIQVGPLAIVVLQRAAG
jgi:glycogen operon protein